MSGVTTPDSLLSDPGDLQESSLAGDLPQFNSHQSRDPQEFNLHQDLQVSNRHLAGDVPELKLPQDLQESSLHLAGDIPRLHESGGLQEVEYQGEELGDLAEDKTQDSALSDRYRYSIYPIKPVFSWKEARDTYVITKEDCTLYRANWFDNKE